MRLSNFLLRNLNHHLFRRVITLQSIRKYCEKSDEGVDETPLQLNECFVHTLQLFEGLKKCGYTSEMASGTTKNLVLVANDLIKQQRLETLAIVKDQHKDTILKVEVKLSAHMLDVEGKLNAHKQETDTTDINVIHQRERAELYKFVAKLVASFFFACVGFIFMLLFTILKFLTPSKKEKLAAQIAKM